MTDQLEAALSAYDSQRWRNAFDALVAADRESPLDIDNLERLGVSAYLIGEDAVCADTWNRAHNESLRLGDPSRAARYAFWHACGLLFRGEMAPAMGWIARGKRVLDESGVDSVEQAWFLNLTNLPVLFSGDVETARPNFLEALEITRRFNDATAMCLARVSFGQSEIMSGRLKEGLALLDEVMVSVTAGEVVPIFVGLAYCAVIDACNRVSDLRRAREWTAALSRWTDAQQGLVPFRGNCLVHRCEIFELQGAWRDAAEAAEKACQVLEGPPPWDTLGYAAYHVGEVHRLRGDLAAAEAAYRRANQAGHAPEPGMSLLRLAQGRTDAAAAAIRRVLDESHDPTARSKILPAAIEIALASGNVEDARSHSEELSQIAGFLDAPLLHAIAGHAAGAVLLAEGDAREALTNLRDAQTVWRQLDVPYEAARTRVLIGVACRELDDCESADLEFDAARAAFEALGAATELERLAGVVGGPAVGTSTPGGLTEREVEVLRLVAAGKTNRQVASELVLSEKTVARHVANIFTKIGVSSRAAATAYAYEHGVVST